MKPGSKCSCARWSGTRPHTPGIASIQAMSITPLQTRNSIQDSPCSYLRRNTNLMDGTLLSTIPVGIGLPDGSRQDGEKFRPTDSLIYNKSL